MSQDVGWPCQRDQQCDWWQGWGLSYSISATLQGSEGGYGLSSITCQWFHQLHLYSEIPIKISRH